MVDKNFKKDTKKMVADGLITLDRDGEIRLTEKGKKHTENLLKNKDSQEYMKKIAKHFGNNPTEKGTANIDYLADEMDMVDNTKLTIYERYNIPENDDLKNYQLFCKMVQNLADDKSNRNHDGFNGMLDLLKSSKYFEIPNNVNLLLQNTSNDIKKVRLPYFYTFLDVELMVGDRIYYCMQIQDRNQVREIAGEKGIDIKDIPEGIDILTFFESPEGIGWEKIQLYEKENDKYRNKIKEYILNFCDFINSEDVKLMFRERSEKNTERRVQRGRIPIPSFNKIKVVGYLAKYLNQLESMEFGTRFSHRFWVRGHFKRFWDKKRYRNMYNKFELGQLKNFEGKKYNIDEGVLRVWIYPYIKGEGMLINKGYIAK